MNENKDDGFQEEYDVDVTSEDTEDIDLFEEDDDIGDLSDFEDEEEESKSNFFGKSKNANSEKKPLNKKNLMVLLGGIGIILILGLLAIPGMIKKSADKNKTPDTEITTGPVYTGDANQTNDTAGTALDVGNGTNETINVNEPCDTLNPNNPSNINNPNCANVLPQNQTQNGSGVTAQQFSNTSGQQQAAAPVYSNPVRQEIPEPVRPEPYQPRNIQKPSSGSLNSLTGGNTANNRGYNQGGSTAGIENNIGTGTQATQTNNGGAGGTTRNQQQTRTRTRPQPVANGVSTFSLQQGSYIPIAISTQINSDNPSYFMAIVSENVYSKDGRHKVLIPMGSKLIGNYAALKNNNDTRVFMMVEKIILPTNKVIMFDNANIIDLKGEIGARGQLNTKFLQRFGKTLLAVSFSVADLALDYRKAKTIANNSNRVSQATWEDLINDPVSSVKDTMDTIDKSWNSVKNRIKIPIGTRLNVLTGNEIVLEEYKRR
jgi:putative conjugal transfer protein (trbI) (fragment)